jgi:hypothetical protein
MAELTALRYGHVTITPVGDLPVPADLLLEPSQVATVRIQVTGLHRAGRLIFEPIFDLIEMLPLDSTVGSLTLRTRGQGPAGNRKICMDLCLAVLGGDTAVGEIEQLAAYAHAAFGSDLSLFRVAPVDDDDLDWPVAGTVTLVRQPTFDTPAGPLPLRFTAGAPAGREKLLRALLAAEDQIDVIVTIQPTRLRNDEHTRVTDLHEQLTGLRERPELPSATRLVDGYPLERLIAAATDTLASYRTQTWMTQIAVVEANARTETTRRAIGRAIGGNFDTRDGGGIRQVANPSSFLAGGFDLVPVKHPDRLLHAARYGQIDQHTYRELTDVATAGELRNLIVWPSGVEGPVPGLDDWEPADTNTDIPASGPGDLIVGTTASGQPVPVPWRVATQHVLHVGTTGAGKSASLLNIGQQAIHDGRGLIVIDSNDDLLRLLATEAHAAGRPVVIIDGASGQFDRVNLVAGDTPEEIDARVYAVIEGSTAGLPTEMYGPVGRRFLEGACRMLARLGLPFSNLSDYATDPALAGKHAKQVGEGWATQFANEISMRKPEDRAELIGWVDAKIAHLRRQVTTDTFLSQASTVDLFAALDAGVVVLINPGEDQSQSRVVAGMVFAYLDRWARTRDAMSSETLVLLDEAQNIAGPLLTRSLTEWRKRAMSLHLATTTLGLLDVSADAAIANTSTIVAFRNRGRTGQTIAGLFDLDAGRLGRLPNLTAYVVSAEMTEPVKVTVPTRPATPERYPDGVVDVIDRRKRVASEWSAPDEDELDETVADMLDRALLLLRDESNADADPARDYDVSQLNGRGDDSEPLMNLDEILDEWPLLSAEFGDQDPF